MGKRHNLDDPPAGPADPAGPDAARASRISQIFNDHNRSLLRFLRGRLYSEDDAREVAQEAYVKLLQLDQLEGVSFLKAFLFRTASNLAIDRLRRRRVQRERAHYLFDFGTAESCEPAYSAAEDANLTLEALAELPAHCRQAFLMSRIEGLSTEEIGVRLGVTDRAVRKYLVRTLLHLQTRLRHENQPDGQP